MYYIKLYLAYLHNINFHENKKQIHNELLYNKIKKVSTTEDWQKYLTDMTNVVYLNQFFWEVNYFIRV